MERLGLVKLQVNLVKRDDELINLIMEDGNFPEEKRDTIAEILRYNVLTLIQMSELIGLAVSTITNKLRPSYRDGEMITELDCCYPFASLNERGPKFIARNEKFRDCVLATLKNNQPPIITSRVGLIAAIYSGQKQSSKARKHPPPAYSRDELTEWLYSKTSFNNLYDKWVESGFKRKLRPSCDRLDDNKGYSFDNIQVITMTENQTKSRTRRGRTK